jgi:hypothetical protein
VPEFYDGKCSYQKQAQPYLAAIARGIKDSAASRAFLLEGTEFERSYAGAKPLWQEQWKKRDPSDSMVCPFWSNYWYEPCPSCDCRIDNSVSMEIDAMFFLQNVEGETLAVHVEMKRDREPLSLGQAEAYRPRAACYRDQRRERKGLLPHDHFMTVLFCGAGTDILSIEGFFDRVILHEIARNLFPDYPTSP